MSGLTIVSGVLVANAPVTAVTTRGRIYPISAPQNAVAPFIVLNQVGGADGLHLNGQNEYPLHRIMVECNATTGTQAHDLGELVLDALRNTIKARIGRFKDVDVTEAGPEITDYSDDRTMSRRVLQFYVRFRRA